MERRARIVATIGPASQDEATLQGLIEAGMDVARLNFSHGSHENHTLVYNRLRTISSRLGRPVTILQDLQGPKIRTGEIENGQVEIHAGQRLTLTTRKVVGNAERVSVDFPGLPKSVQPGGRILLDDGALELTVVEVSGDLVETKVVTGGLLKPHKGVNLPWARLRIPALTRKDVADLEFGLKLGVDALAISFVRSAENLMVARQKIEKLAPQRSSIPIIAAWSESKRWQPGGDHQAADG
jgi:pyruvate kinase